MKISSKIQIVHELARLLTPLSPSKIVLSLEGGIEKVQIPNRGRQLPDTLPSSNCPTYDSTDHVSEGTFHFQYLFDISTLRTST